MRVVGKEEGKLARLEREPSFRFAVEKFDVALFVVAQTVFQTTSVYPAVGFLSADGGLDVDVFQMRFRLGIGFAPHRFAADKEADIGVCARHLSVGQGGEIQRLQQPDGVGEVGVQRGVAGGVGDGVGHHVLKDGTEKGRLKKHFLQDGFL